MKFELRQRECFKNVKIGEIFEIADENYYGIVYVKIATDHEQLTDTEGSKFNAFDLCRGELDSIDDHTSVRIIKGTFVEEGVNNDNRRTERRKGIKRYRND